MKLEPLQLKAFSEGVQAEKKKRNTTFVSNAKEEEPETPTYDEADIKNAEREGYQKGFLQGINEGRAQAQSEQSEINKQIAAFSTQFQNAVMPMLRHYQQYCDSIQRQVNQTAFSIAKKVAGKALEHNAEQKIAEIAQEYCTMLMHQSQLSIRVQEKLGDTLEQSLHQLAQAMPDNTEIVIVRDPNMPITDCKIEWNLGSAEHSIDQIWEKVEHAVQNMDEIAIRDHHKAMDELQSEVENANNTNQSGNIEDSNHG